MWYNEYFNVALKISWYLTRFKNQEYNIVEFNVPLDALEVILETVFGSYDPTNSVIALKDDG